MTIICDHVNEIHRTNAINIRCEIKTLYLCIVFTLCSKSRAINSGTLVIAQEKVENRTLESITSFYAQVAVRIDWISTKECNWENPIVLFNPFFRRLFAGLEPCDRAVGSALVEVDTMSRKSCVKTSSTSNVSRNAKLKEPWRRFVDEEDSFCNAFSKACVAGPFFNVASSIRSSSSRD